MNQINKSIMLLLLSVCMSGCASTSGYLKDRKRDAADIVTATVGVGFGAKAQIGPIATAVPFVFFADSAGIRGGQFYRVGIANLLGDKEPDSGSAGYPWIVLDGFFTNGRGPQQKESISMEEFRLLAARHKAFQSDALVKMSGDACLPGFPFLNTAKATQLRAPGETAPDYMYAQIDKDKPGPRHFYTQVEVILALGGGVRIGFNPGELLDFLLGWTTVDIFKDDIGKMESNDPAHPSSQGSQGGR